MVQRRNALGFQRNLWDYPCVRKLLKKRKKTLEIGKADQQYHGNTKYITCKSHRGSQLTLVDSTKVREQEKGQFEVPIRHVDTAERQK